MEIVSTLNFFKRENIMNRYKRLNVLKDSLILFIINQMNFLKINDSE